MPSPSSVLSASLPPPRQAGSIAAPLLQRALNAELRSLELDDLVPSSDVGCQLWLQVG